MRITTTTPMGEPLGSGSFGTVYKLKDLPIARKCIPLTEAGHGLPPEAIREIACLQRLKKYDSRARINCIDILGIQISRTAIMIDMELMTGGTLGDLLDSSQLQPALLLSYSVQIVKGLCFLHGVSIIHRDVTPRNILISSSNCLKIADFGLSHVMSGSEPRTPLVCSLYYRAPELLRVNAFVGDTRSLVYTCAVDNWSAGCILREMIIGQGPEFKPVRSTSSPATSAIEQLDAIIRYGL
ncbi:serine/threonine-protein kinase crk1 [Colletotrichum acutatum]